MLVPANLYCCPGKTVFGGNSNNMKSMLFLSENQIFIGGIGLGSQQLTTVEFYNIASDTWRISSTATVSPETIFFAHVDAGDLSLSTGTLSSAMMTVLRCSML